MNLPVWSTACPDWERRLIAGESIIPPPIFPRQADQALAIFKELRVVDLPGKPTFGECSDQWVFDFVAAIFGAYDHETGNQLIREFLLLISKKNTKSTIAAGIMLTATIICWRDDEEHLILAPTKEVADNSFKPAAGMVRADDDLSALFHVQDHIRTITHRVTGASLKVVAADTDTVSGKKAGRVMVDEHWLFGTKPKAKAMLMEATGGQVSRNEGWVIYLTTQSEEPPAGVFKEKLDYYRDVRDGKIVDNKSLGILYEFPAAMIAAEAYLKPENFYVTNPNLGRSVSAQWIEDELRKNQHSVDGSIQQFLAKHLNVEIGLNLRAGRWPGADFWAQQGKRKVTLETLLSECDVIDVGIDGGGLADLLGYAATGRHAISREWLVWTAACCHESLLERHKDQASTLRDFERDGDLFIVKKVGDDVAMVAEWTSRIHSAGLLDMVGADPAGIGAILDALVGAGIPQEKIIGISQGWRMSGAIKTVERKLAEGVMIHGGQRLMNYCVSNAKVEPKGNAMLITKQASGAGKIDPLMALFDAASLLALNPASPKKDPTVRFL